MSEAMSRIIIIVVALYAVWAVLDYSFGLVDHSPRPRVTCRDAPDPEQCEEDELAIYDGGTD